MQSDDPEVVGALRETFLHALDLAPDSAVTGLTFGAHPRWDSLGQMTLVACIEERFGVRLDGDQVVRLDSFAAAIEILRSALLQAGTKTDVQEREPERTPV